MTKQWTSAVLLALALIAVDVRAQEDDEPEVHSEIVVTAERREASLKEVPSSITVITSDEMTRAGIEEITEAALYVPNLFVSTFTSKRTSSPYLRGIGAGQGDPAVTTYIDGVPQLFPSSTNIDLFNLERIEFLRGPQGALYGRNTIGGLIHYISAKPSNELEVDLRLDGGEDGYNRQSVHASGPISKDRAYYSVDLSREARDGFVENTLTGNDVDEKDGVFGRVKLLFTPNESTSVEFSAHTQRDRDGGFILYDLGSLRNNPYVIGNDFEGETERDLAQYSLNFTYRGSGFDLFAVASFADFDTFETSDLDFSELDLLRRNTFEDQDQLYGEVRLASAETVDTGFGGLDWVAGVSYYDSGFTHNSANEFRPNFLGLVGIPFPNSLFDAANYDLDDSGVSLFGQATLYVGDKFEVILGGRFVDEDKDVDLVLISELVGLAAPDLGVTSGAFNESFSEFLPRVGFAYELTENTRLHALAAKSYRAGGYNFNTAPFGPLEAGLDRFRVDEEIGWNYELGFKSTLADDRVYVAATLFSIDWEDRQLSVPDPFQQGRFFLDNVADSTSEGVEIEVNARAGEYWSFSSGLGLTNAEFDNYISPNTGENVDSNRLPTSPDSTFYVAANYQREIADDFNLIFRGDFSRIGNRFFDVDNTVKDPYYTVAAFRAGIEHRGVRIEAWVRNAFDEDYITTALPGNFSPSGYAGENGTPRQYAVTVGYRY